MKRTLCVSVLGVSGCFHAGAQLRSAELNRPAEGTLGGQFTAGGYASGHFHGESRNTAVVRQFSMIDVIGVGFPYLVGSTMFGGSIGVTEWSEVGLQSGAKETRFETRFALVRSANAWTPALTLNLEGRFEHTLLAFAPKPSSGDALGGAVGLDATWRASPVDSLATTLRVSYATEAHQMTYDVASFNRHAVPVYSFWQRELRINLGVGYTWRQQDTLRREVTVGAIAHFTPHSEAIAETCTGCRQPPVSQPFNESWGIHLVLSGRFSLWKRP